jgi:hypothetical protein
MTFFGRKGAKDLLNENIHFLAERQKAEVSVLLVVADAHVRARRRYLRLERFLSKICVGFNL